MTENDTKWCCLTGILILIAMVLLVASAVVHVNTPPEDLTGHALICGSIIFLVPAAFILCTRIVNREREEL